MRGVKHAGWYWTALARGEVLLDVSADSRRHRPALPRPRSAGKDLVGSAHRGGRDRRGRRPRAVVVASEHVALNLRQGGGR